MTALLSSGTRVTLATTTTRTARSSRQTTSFMTAAPPAPVMAVSIKLSLGGTERAAPTRYRLLGSVTGADISSGITIPVTDTPGNGIIVVAWAGGNRGTAFDDEFRITAATDPSGTPWSIAHTGANVGAVRDAAAGGTNPVCEAGSVTRACVTGDLAPGDTIHLTESFSSFPATATFAAVAVFIPGVANAAGAWEDPLGSGPFVDYGNGDFISTRSPDGKTLSFGVDWGTHPYPVNDSLMLAVSASNPGYPWTPFTFAKLAEAIPGGGGVQVALSVGAVAASTTRECGGAFSSVTDVGTLGFQFVTEPAPASVLTIQLPN